MTLKTMVKNTCDFFVSTHPHSCLFFQNDVNSLFKFWSSEASMTLPTTNIGDREKTSPCSKRNTSSFIFGFFHVCFGHCSIFSMSKTHTHTHTPTHNCRVKKSLKTKNHWTKHYSQHTNTLFKTKELYVPSRKFNISHNMKRKIIDSKVQPLLVMIFYFPGRFFLKSTNA